MNDRTKALLRASAALLLTFGFYGLALAIMLGLFALPVYFYQSSGNVPGRLSLFAVASGLTIAAALIPRRIEFRAPGPRLSPDEHPRLFQVIRDVADRAGQRMPEEIYLIPDVNAFVSHRGGWLGLGGTRVMGLGHPLMQVLSVSEFRAVVAHEFGHFHGGDTSIGPFIYQTRSAIARTIAEVGSGVLRLPFTLYGTAYVRLTQGISRRQELAADALAAQIAGPRAVANGLRKIHAIAPAHSAFFLQEVLPIWSANRAPSLAEGFERFLGQDWVRDLVEREARSGEASDRPADPFDSHPPLRERVRHLEALAAVMLRDEPHADATGAAGGSSPAPDGAHSVEQDGHTAVREPRALTLLNRLESLDLRLAEWAPTGLELGAESYDLTAPLTRTGRLETPGSRPPRPLEWADACREIWLREWSSLVETDARSLHGLPIDALPAAVVPGGSLCNSIAHALPDESVEQAPAIARYLAGCSLACTLAQNGWALEKAPGGDAVARKGGRFLEPFRIMDDLGDRGGADRWKVRLKELGLADLWLTSTPSSPPRLAGDDPDVTQVLDGWPDTDQLVA